MSWPVPAPGTWSARFTGAAPGVEWAVELVTVDVSGRRALWDERAVKEALTAFARSASRAGGLLPPEAAMLVPTVVDAAAEARSARTIRDLEAVALFQRSERQATKGATS